MALRKIHTLPPNNYAICSDSCSAIHALKNRSRTSNPILTKILNLLHVLHAKCKIVFIWIPGHSGITGNELVDDLAKQETRSNHDAATAEITADDAKIIYESLIIQDWQNLWLNTTNNKLRTLKADTKKWLTSSHAQRRTETTLTRLRIGHTALTHSHILEKEPPPICDTCNELITVEHILTTCTKYNRERISSNLPASLKDILQDDEVSLLNVQQFLELTNLKNKI